MAATGGGSTSAVPARGMSYVDESGVTMEWDAERGAYFPKASHTIVAAVAC